MSRIIKKDATSQSLYFEALDSTSTVGGRKTGLAYNTASLTAYYARNGATPVAITLATLAAANSAWSSGGFKEVDSTNMPGLYRLDVPDAAFASGADSVVVTLRGASGMVQVSTEIQLGPLDASVTQWAGAAVASPNTAGVPVVDTRSDIRVGTAQATGNSTTAIKLDAGSSSATNFYRGHRITILSGTGAGQSAICTSYNGTSKIANITPAWAAAPDATSVFVVTANGHVDVEMWRGDTAVAMTGDSYARLGAPTGVTIAGDISTVLSEITGTVEPTLSAIYDQTGDTAIRAAVGLAAADLDAQFTAIDDAIDTEVAAIKAKTDGLPSSPASASDVAGLLTTPLADVYAANGAPPTLQQALMAIHQHMMSFQISGTSRTVKKLDGSTAFVEALDSATAPTALTR